MHRDCRYIEYPRASGIPYHLLSGLARIPIKYLEYLTEYHIEYPTKYLVEHIVPSIYRAPHGRPSGLLYRRPYRMPPMVRDF